MSHRLRQLTSVLWLCWTVLSTEPGHQGPVKVCEGTVGVPALPGMGAAGSSILIPGQGRVRDADEGDVDQELDWRHPGGTLLDDDDD